VWGCVACVLWLTTVLLFLETLVVVGTLVDASVCMFVSNPGRAVWTAPHHMHVAKSVCRSGCGRGGFCRHLISRVVQQTVAVKPKRRPRIFTRTIHGRPPPPAIASIKIWQGRGGVPVTARPECESPPCDARDERQSWVCYFK
jgi:hypothetical protein